MTPTRICRACGEETTFDVVTERGDLHRYGTHRRCHACHAIERGTRRNRGASRRITNYAGSRRGP